MSLGLVINSRRVVVPGVNVVTWLDDAKSAPKITDGRPRGTPTTAVVLHTSRGKRGNVQPGSKPSTRAELLARYQARTERQVSWHLTIDTDGDTFQQEDLSAWMAWHVEEANGHTVGIELVQHPDSGDLWQVQLDACVQVVTAICDTLSIPKRVPTDGEGAPWSKPVPAWVMRKYHGPGQKWPGVLGHRHLVPDTVRGPGDPGDAIFRALLKAGFEAYDVTARA